MACASEGNALFACVGRIGRALPPAAVSILLLALSDCLVHLSSATCALGHSLQCAGGYDAGVVWLYKNTRCHKGLNRLREEVPRLLSFGEIDSGP